MGAYVIIDLGATLDLESVRIHQRNDGCCQDRLQNFTVTVLADDGGLPGNVVNGASYFGQPLTNGFAEVTFPERITTGPTPALHLTFDEISAVPVDRINGATVTVNDAPNQNVDGIDGSGIQFDGSNDYLTVAAPADIAADEFTVVTWFKDVSTGNWKDIWAFQTSSGSHYSAEIRGDGQAAGYNVGGVPGATTVSQTGGTNLRDGAWHQVAYSFSKSAGTATIYIDGVQNSQASGWAADESIISFRIANDFRAENRYINGFVDEFQVYGEALSANQIAELNTSPGAYLGSATVAVTVTGVNDAPVFAATSVSASFDENATGVIHVALATDVDNGDSVTYSIASTLDGATFSVDSAEFTVDASGNLTFVAAPDYENPTDVGGDNVYHVTVRATDQFGGMADQNITVTVNNLDGSLVSQNPDNGGRGRLPGRFEREWNPCRFL